MSLSRTAQVLKSMAKVVALPPLVPPGHFYSPLTNPADARRAIEWASNGSAPLGLNMDVLAMRRLATSLAPMWREVPQDQRYHQDEMYVLSDAAVYHSLLRHLAPAQVLEVGSGFSTAVALDARDAFGLATSLTCIEPFPTRLRSLLRADDEVDIRATMVQDNPLDDFLALESNDVLFIDSTHVVKAGSDVVWTTLNVLPRLQAGVIVHIHDIFWPMEYIEPWLRERRDWNEIYLIHAFLSGNSEWEVLLFNDYVWQTMPDLVEQHLNETVGQRPGGLWLRKVL